MQNLALSDDSVVLLKKIAHFTNNLEIKIDAFEIMTQADTIIAKSLKDEATQLEKMVENMRIDAVTPYNEHVKQVNNKAKEYSLPILGVKEKIVAKIKKYEIDKRNEENRVAGIIKDIIQKIDKAESMDELEMICNSLPNEARNPTVDYCVTIKKAKIIEELRNEEIRILREQEEMIKKEMERLKDAEALRLYTIEIEKKEEERKKEEEENERDIEKEISSSVRKIENEIVMQKSSIRNTRTVWKAKIFDPLLVPREFCTPNDSIIREAVKSGVREISGVRIFEDIFVG